MKISCRWLSIILCLLISLFGVLDAQPAIAQESYKLGEDALQKDDYAQAIQYFTEHLKNPLKYERYEEATREFERIRKYATSDIDNAQTFAGLGRIALEQGNITQAITHYKHAIQLGLETTEIHHYLGIAYMQNRDGQNAIKQFHQALALNADFPESHLMLGTLYTTNRKFEVAEKHYLHAIALAPEMAAAYHGLAYLYGQHESNLEKAIELARKATELSPKSAPYYNTLSWLCYKTGKFDEAETAILKAIELEPDNTVWSIKTV